MTTLTFTNDAKLTNGFLRCGILAGPLYVGLGLIQMAIRPGGRRLDATCALSGSTSARTYPGGTCSGGA
jgi:hypothetical protein